MAFSKKASGGRKPPVRCASYCSDASNRGLTPPARLPLLQHHRERGQLLLEYLLEHDGVELLNLGQRVVRQERVNLPLRAEIAPGLRANLVGRRYRRRAVEDRRERVRRKLQPGVRREPLQVPLAERGPILRQVAAGLARGELAQINRPAQFLEVLLRVQRPGDRVNHGTVA